MCNKRNILSLISGVLDLPDLFSSCTGSVLANLLTNFWVSFWTIRESFVCASFSLESNYSIISIDEGDKLKNTDPFVILAMAVILCVAAAQAKSFAAHS